MATSFAHPASPASASTTARLGGWSAWWFAVTIVLFDIGAGFGAAGWPVGAWPSAAALLIVPGFVVLTVCLHLRAGPESQAWSLSVLAFAVVYAALEALNYGLQITVVREFPDLYALLTLDLVPQSAFWALEVVAYAVQSLATLFLVPVVWRGPYGKIIAAIFTANGAGVVFAFAAYLVTGSPSHPLAILSLAVWGLSFPVAGVLLALGFREGL